jgi:dTDP-4-amino-4,6-dideoxygalactose transaminase
MDSVIPMIPQANPGASYRALQEYIDAEVLGVLASGSYILGGAGAAFETEFAAWLGADFAIGCGNGTDGLTLALRGLGVGRGDAVATVSHTAVATVAAIEMAGAMPVLVDIDPNFYTMDPEDLGATLAHPPPSLPPIRAVIVVHLYGLAAELDTILANAAQYGAVVIEDCAQAHGASYKGRTIGTLGHAAAFSFYPTKNLGAFGDAGAVTTSIADLAERLRVLRQYGWRRRYVSDHVGINSRLDEIQAAILRVKLRTLDANNLRRRRIADAYDSALKESGIAGPQRRPDCVPVFHQYVLRVPDRDAVQRALFDHGVGTAIHYPTPVHLQPAYAGRVHLGPSACRNTEVAAAQVLSLPIYPELSDQQVELVCAALRKL